MRLRGVSRSPKLSFWNRGGKGGRKDINSPRNSSAMPSRSPREEWLPGGEGVNPELTSSHLTPPWAAAKLMISTLRASAYRVGEIPVIAVNA